MATVANEDIKIWDLKSGKVEKTLKGHSKKVQCVQLDIKLGLVVSGSSDCEVRLWALDTGECIRVLSGHKEAVRSVKFDREMIVSSSDDGTVISWRHNGVPIHTFAGHTAGVDNVVFNEIITVTSSTKDCTGFFCDFERKTKATSSESLGHSNRTVNLSEESFRLPCIRHGPHRRQVGDYS